MKQTSVKLRFRSVNAFAKPGRPESEKRTLLTDEQLSLVHRKTKERVKKDHLTALEPKKRARDLFKQQICIEFNKKAPASDEFYRRRTNLDEIKLISYEQKQGFCHKTFDPKGAFLLRFLLGSFSRVLLEFFPQFRRS